MAIFRFGAKRNIESGVMRLTSFDELYSPQGLEPGPRVASSASSKRISRRLNACASLCEDDILSMGFQTAQITKKTISKPCSDIVFFGDPYGNRTHVTAVKGPCLNRLTNGPYSQNADKNPHFVW